MSVGLFSSLGQSNEVKGAYHCEKEGFELAVNFIGKERIGTLVTDRHRQIASWIRENLTNVKHYYDVWHIAKSKLPVTDNLFKYYWY